jgi:hypothetical protein
MLIFAVIVCMTKVDIKHCPSSYNAKRNCVGTVERMVQQITARRSCSRMEESPRENESSRSLPHQWW